MILENSFLGKSWKSAEYDERHIIMLSQRYQLDSLITKLLFIRNVDDEKIELFLKPDLINQLPEPNIFKDMKVAIEKLYNSIINKETIGIIADYDVDGSSSAALLIKFLESININYLLEIPDRINEGFGPNKRIIKNLIDKRINLLITLDCGTSSLDIFTKNLSKKIDTIIIDHHVSEMNLPNAYSIINPNRHDEKSDYKNLAAVGVTFMFLIGLRRYLRENNFYINNNFNEQNLTSYLDLVALGTVCDVAPITDLNRAFVKKGLEIIHKRSNKGISTLIDISNIRHKPNVTDLSFNLGPKLNAASRIGDARLASKVLFSKNLDEIESICRKLKLLNEKRKIVEESILIEAREQALKQVNKKIIIVYAFNWHDGVLGIVASKLVEEFLKPIIVISKKEYDAIGSARSIDGFDLGSLIIMAKQAGILIRGGGHKMAAGLKINNNKINTFIDFIEKETNIRKIKDQKENIFDLIVSFNQVNSKFLDDLEILGPYGNGNQEPVFLIKNLRIIYTKLIKEKHIIIKFNDNFDNSANAICFNSNNTLLGDNLLNSKNKLIHIIGNINKDNFSKKNNFQITIIDALKAN